MSETAPHLPLVGLVLVAAGRGERAGGDIPKQYQRIAGTSLIQHTVSRLKHSFEGRTRLLIQPVIRAGDEVLWQSSVGIDAAILPPVYGGATRQQSVKAGLLALENHNPEYAFIHDGARPFVTPALIARLLEACRADGAVPAVPVVDSLVRAEDGAITPVDRTGLMAVQTPQAFPFVPILAAHSEADHDTYTDDATVFTAAGGMCHYIDGEEANFKVTTPDDFKKAERHIMMELADVRTGTGFDVHAFDAGDRVFLCGVQIPFDRKLKGHSDADVALHALTDAILAAIADGDIGAHFPPTEAKWKGADSSVFLDFACERVRARGGMISHLGVLIICEAPKIRPHVERMRLRISEITGVAAQNISVQATTTEKLGFTGRREGIAAQASATVRLPFTPFKPNTQGDSA